MGIFVCANQASQSALIEPALIRLMPVLNYCDTSYVLFEQAARGTAEEIIFQNADGSLSITEGSYTVCEPGDNSWLLVGQNIEVKPTNRSWCSS